MSVTQFPIDAYKSLPSGQDCLANYGGGGYPPDMDARIDKIEVRIDKIERAIDRLISDISSLKQWVIGIALASLGITIAVLTLHTSWLIHDSNRNWETSQKALEKIETNLLRLERLDAQMKDIKVPLSRAPASTVPPLLTTK